MTDDTGFQCQISHPRIAAFHPTLINSSLRKDSQYLARMQDPEHLTCRTMSMAPRRKGMQWAARNTT
jgi:hypothetical protein